MPLKAGQVRNTARALQPAFISCSPALGLALLNAPSFLNNLYALRLPKTTPHGFGPACELARELYFKRDSTDDPKPCRNPAKPSFHTTPRVLGHILGLALTDAREEDVVRVLKREGIETNRVKGEWTGVSLARYKRLVVLTKDALKVDRFSPAVPLVSRLAWEKCSDKLELVDFLSGIAEHVGPNNLVNPEWIQSVSESHNGRLRLNFNSDFCDAAFDTLDDVYNIDQASATLAHGSYLKPDGAALEALIHALAQRTARKPAWKIGRHTYRGSNVVPDCVEVCVRELIDFLVFDDETATWDISRLPLTTDPKVIEFYRKITEADNAWKTNEDAIRSSTWWFTLCQGIEGCKYISSAPDGSPFELFPSVINVTKCVDALLGLTGKDSPQGENLTSFVARLNAALKMDETYRVLAEERREMYRPALSEESRRREIMVLKKPKSKYYLELTLESAHRLATVRRGRLESDGGWIIRAREEHTKMLIASEGLSPLASSVWPALLGGSQILLDNASRDSTMMDVFTIVTALWGRDRARWHLDKLSFTAEHTDQEKRMADVASMQQVRTALKILNQSRTMSEEIKASLLAFILENDSSYIDKVDVIVTSGKLKRETLQAALSTCKTPRDVLDLFNENVKLTWKDRMRLWWALQG